MKHLIMTFRLLNILNNCVFSSSKVDTHGLSMLTSSCIRSVSHNPQAQIKRPTATSGAAPIMRPMSASSIISVRQVDSQIKASTQEQEDLQKSISDRFNSLRTLFDTLPTEPPKPILETRPSSLTPCDDLNPPVSSSPTPSSRCGSRLRIRKAQQFAADNFEDT